MGNKGLKVGDKVKYTSKKYFDERSNPLWGGKCGKIGGAITRISRDGLPIGVAWDNGEYNSYNYSDLELIKREQKQLKLFKE